MNKITKADDVIINFIKEHYIEISIIVITLISLIIRFCFLGFVSDDYKNCLSGWIEQIKQVGGISAIGKEIGDYNTPYFLIIILLTYLPINPMVAIKLVSIIFDYILAMVVVTIVYEFIKEKKNNGLTLLITYSIMVLLPTLILNSAAWGQCDSIYTTFVMLSLLFVLKNKYTKAFIFLGIAFAFKLQTIFVLPVFIILYLCNRKFSIFNFLIIPAVFIVMSIPAIIAGRSIISCLQIYVNQAGNYAGALTMNYPGIYSIFIPTIGNDIPRVYEGIPLAGILFTIAIFAIVAISSLAKEKKFDNEMIINLALWSVLICVFFLPRMHDRYMYMADILSVVLFIINRKKIYLPIGISMVSIYTYFRFFFNVNTIPMEYVAILNFVLIAICSNDIIKKICTKEVKSD